MKRSLASIASAALTLATVPMAFAHVPFASAQDSERTVKPPVQISIGNDTYMAGEEVNITTAVNGNLNVAGGKVNIGSTIAGDLQVAGGEVAVTGGVRDNMRVLGGEVSISGRVNGTLTVVSGQVHIEKNAVVVGGMLVAGGSVVIDGVVEGALKARSGDVVINGTIKGITDINADTAAINGIVGGNATVVATSFTVGDTSNFNGNLDYWSQQGQQDLAGRVSGNATFKPELAPLRDEAKSEKGMFLGLLGGITLFSLFSAAFTIGLFLFFTRNFFKESAKYLNKQPWMSLLIGFLFVILTPIVIFILFVTFIGIPVALALFAGYLVFLFFSSTLASLVLARWVELRNKKNWHPVTIFFLTLGIFIGLKLLWIIPFLGWLANFVLVFMALGALMAMKQHVYMKAR